MNHVQLMRQAKAQLQGNWLNSAIAYLIFTAIVGAASFTYIGELILFGPLIFGFYLFIMCVVDTRRANFNLLFQAFSTRFVDTLIAGILYSLAISIGFALLIVPGIILSLGFAMTFFILVDDPNISGIDALGKSWNMMNGHKWDYFCLMCRFIGWGLLCLLTFGIGFFWLQSYVTATTLNYYRQLPH